MKKKDFERRRRVLDVFFRRRGQIFFSHKIKRASKPQEEGKKRAKHISSVVVKRVGA